MANHPDAAMLSVHCDDELGVRWSKLDVDIDGVVVGRLCPGDECSWEVSKARHEVRVAGVVREVDVDLGYFVRLRARWPVGRFTNGPGWVARPSLVLERWGPNRRPPP